ncbi:MAG TPA: hypothetical protein VEW04_06820 [Allosphingosinicella sp.]|nr:hypothetical protein [Allosphingosinicella sp.]
MTDGDKTENFAELREKIEAGLAKSKRLVARSRELLGAVARDEPEPPAIKPHNPTSR